jgi:aminomethyltransferase
VHLLEDCLTITPEILRTPLYDWHREHGGRLVEFGGWSMPVQYSTIVLEHKAVRERAGLFDISHMGRLAMHGPGTLAWIERVTTNEAGRLAAHQIQYSLMTNERGGIIDDILVYNQSFAHLVVCNASNRMNVLGQFERYRQGADATLQDRTQETAMLALQGPRALEILQPLYDQPLEPVAYYTLTMGRVLDRFDAVVSRTGYTGEDGFEIIVGAGAALEVWTALLEAGAPHEIVPCGLGARDTLRLEAAMPLYGHELSEEINPYSAGLGWAVKLDKGEFAGREPLVGFKSKPGRKRVGLALDGKRSLWREGGGCRDVGHLFTDIGAEHRDGDGGSIGRRARAAARGRDPRPS